MPLLEQQHTPAPLQSPPLLVYLVEILAKNLDRAFAPGNETDNGAQEK